MKIIVCGAGLVGTSIARYLASEADNEVTIIDTEADRLRELEETMDVRTFLGHPAYPAVLEDAGATDADLLVALSHSDELNIVACLVAKSRFKVTTCIARLRALEYMTLQGPSLFAEEGLKIDVVISPEVAIAKAILRNVRNPDSFEVIPMAGDRARLIGIRCDDTTSIINTPLRQLSELFPLLNAQIVHILRDGKSVVPSDAEMLQPKDDVFFVVETAHLPRFFGALGKEVRASRNLLVLGGGRIAGYLVKELLEDNADLNIKLVEQDPKKALRIAENYKDVSVIQGNFFDAGVLDEAGLSAADTLIAVSEDDESNVFAALLSKQKGVPKVLALLNQPSFASLVGRLGVDSVIDADAIMVSTILQYIRKGSIRAAYSLGEHVGEMMEADILPGSELIEKNIGEIDWPAGVWVGMIVNQSGVHPPTSHRAIHTNDRLLLFVPTDSIEATERLFSAHLNFF